MAKRITQDDIERINVLYKELKTYAAVARELGIAPSTVKKYVISDFSVVEQNIEKINKEIINTPINSKLINEDWTFTLMLSVDEYEDLKLLKKELLV